MMTSKQIEIMASRDQNIVDVLNFQPKFSGVRRERTAMSLKSSKMQSQSQQHHLGGRRLVNREVQHLAQHAADRYSAENDHLREMYWRAATRRLEMLSHSRKASQEPSAEVVEGKGVADQSQEQFLASPSVFRPSDAARVLPQQAITIAAQSVKEDSMEVNEGSGLAERLRPAAMKQPMTLEDDMKSREQEVKPVSTRVLEIDDLLNNPQFHKGTIQDQSQLFKKFKKIYREQAINKRTAQLWHQSQGLPKVSTELLQRPSVHRPCRNPLIVNPTGRKLSVLEAVGVKLPTDRRAKREQEEEERQLRLLELERQLTSAHSPSKLNKHSESYQSQSHQIIKKAAKKDAAKPRDEQFHFPPDKYLMGLGTRKGKLALDQASGRADEVPLDPEVLATYQPGPFENQMRHVEDIQALYEFLDKQLEDRKHFDPEDPELQQEFSHEQLQLSNSYIKYQAYDLYKLIMDRDYVARDDFQYQQYILNVFKYFPENPVQDSNIQCGIKNLVEAKFHQPNLQSSSNNPETDSAPRLTKQQILACNHDYSDEGELQRRYRLQLWFLNFYKYIYCLIYTSRLLQLQEARDDEDAPVDVRAIENDKRKLAEVKASIVGWNSLQNKKLLARGKQAQSNMLRRLSKQADQFFENEEEREVFQGYLQTKALLESPILKLIALEHPQAFIDYTVAGQMSEEAQGQDQRELYSLGSDIEPHLHDQALLVIKKFKNCIVQIKKRRYVTFKNVDEEADMLFSGLEIKRILQKIEDDNIAAEKSLKQQSLTAASKAKIEEASEVKRVQEERSDEEPLEQATASRKLEALGDQLSTIQKSQSPDREYAMELTTKDVIKQLIYLINEKQNCELINQFDKVLKKHINPQMTQTIESTRIQLQKKQAAALRKQQVQQHAAPTLVAAPAKGPHELLSNNLDTGIKVALYREYMQSEPVKSKRNKIETAQLGVNDKTGKAYYMDYLSLVAGVTLKGENDEGIKMQELLGMYDLQIVKRLGDQIGTESSKSLIRDIVMKTADDAIPFVFKHMQAHTILLKDDPLTIENAISIKHILQLIGAVEKADKQKKNAKEMEKFGIRTLIVDDCNATDEVFEQILLGIEAQEHVRNIHYVNHNRLGKKATAVLRRICARNDSSCLVELNLSNIRIARPELMTKAFKAAKQEDKLMKQAQAPPSDEEEDKIEAENYLAEIIQEIEDTKRIKRLKLTDLELDDEASIQNIVDILQSNYGLSYINLASSKIKLANLARISSEFRQCQQLEYLNLGGNRVDAGFSAETQDRLKNAKYQVKAQRSAELLEIFIQNICDLIEQPYSKLKHVDISNMGLKREQIRTILRSVQKNTVLQSFNLGQLESVDDAKMVRDMLNIWDQDIPSVPGPLAFPGDTIREQAQGNSTFKNAYINNGLKNKFKKDVQMVQATIFDESPELALANERPLILNRSSQHRELVFNRFRPFKSFDHQLNRKWLIVRDCAYCKRYRYTLVYFNQREPESNDFRVLEGQEPLMEKIEELAHKAKLEEGASASHQFLIDRKDPMIIAGGHLHRMVDPIVFAGHLCMEEILSTKREQLDAQKQPLGALDITSFDLDRMKITQKDVQRQRAYDAWLSGIEESELRQSLCELADEVITADSLQCQSGIQQKIAKNFEAANWERMLESKLYNADVQEHLLVVNRQPYEYHGNVAAALKSSCPSPARSASSGCSEDGESQQEKPAKQELERAERSSIKRFNDAPGYTGPSLTSPAVYVFAAFLPPGPNTLTIYDRINRKVYQKDILVQPAGAKTGLLGGDWTTGPDETKFPALKISEEEMQRIDEQYEIDVDADQQEKQNAKKMPWDQKRTYQELFRWEDEPRYRGQLVPSGVKPTELIPLPNYLHEVVSPEAPADEMVINPLSDSFTVNTKQVGQPMSALVNANWAWHFRHTPAGGTPIYENFTDAQCLLLEHSYQKREKAMKQKQNKKTETQQEQPGSEHQIFPLDERYLIDLKFMVMYLQRAPDCYYPIFRTKSNTRLSASHFREHTFFLPAPPPEPDYFQLMLNPRKETTLHQLSTWQERHADDPGPPEKEKLTGLFPVQYRGVYVRNGACRVTRESFRNQMGKKYVRDRKKKMPSLNQLINSFVLLQYKQMKDRIDVDGVGDGQRATLEDIVQMEEAVGRLREAIDKAFSAFPDRDKPLELKVLEKEPDSPVVKASLYLFAMGGEYLQYLLQQACKEQDLATLKLVGPFAAVVGEIARSAESHRTDNKHRPLQKSASAAGPVEDDAGGFTTYCGTSMTKAEIEGLRYIVRDQEQALEAFEQANAAANRKAAKPMDSTLYSYHLEGFNVASLAKGPALLRALRSWKHHGRGGRSSHVPVLLAFNVIPAAKDGSFAGIRLNRPDYAPWAVAGVDEGILMPDGTDTLVEKVEEVYDETLGRRITVVHLRQINDWSKSK